MKRITMQCYNVDNEVESGSSYVVKDYEDVASWHEMIDQFNSFLCSMGYIPMKYNMFVTPIDNEDKCCAN